MRYLAVSGPSMEPALRDADWVLAVTGGRARVGDVVVVEHPSRPGYLMVKRVGGIVENGYWVLGDSPAQSTDSRHFGVVPRIVGRVVWRVRPWGPVR